MTTRMTALLGMGALTFGAACGAIAPEISEPASLVPPPASSDAPGAPPARTPAHAAPDAGVTPSPGDASMCAPSPLTASGKALFLAFDASRSFAPYWSATVDGATTFLGSAGASSIALGGYVAPHFLSFSQSDASATMCDDNVPIDVPLGAAGTTANGIGTALSHRTAASGASVADHAIREASNDAVAFVSKQPPRAVTDVAIVLVTAATSSSIAACPWSGAPGPAAVTAEAARARAAQPSAPVYVIAVGAPDPGLDGIASAGGTEHATWIDPASDVAVGISTALGAVATSAFRCHFASAAVDLASADPTNVRVTARAADGKLRELARAADCASNPAGWRFDDAGAGRGIVLCADACTAVDNGDVPLVDACGNANDE